MGLEEREFTCTESDFRFIADLVHEQTGIVLKEHKRDMVYSRLARRLRSLNLQTFREYCDILTGADGHSELAHFINAMTTNLTSFFREPHHFEHLGREVLSPLVVKPPPGKRVRIWSAGCSSGAEPYSISMVLASILPSPATWDAKILATDIDTNMLETGKRGEYPREYADKVPPAYASKFISEAPNGKMRVNDSLKHFVAFKPLNLLESWPVKGPFDAIFCRNVVIYFDKETQRALFNRFADLLKPDGWLYIGHSENLHNVSDRFKLMGRTIYRRAR